MIREGERTEPGKPIQKSYVPTNNRCARIDIYQSTLGAVRYVTDPGVSLLGSFPLDVSKSENPEILVTMEFGATTLKVTAAEKKNGAFSTM